MNILTQKEYTTLVRWLTRERMRPGDLLKTENMSSAAMATGLDPERLKILLDRGMQLGFAVEEWQQNGIWVVSRSDPEYPTRYKQHLKDKAPPLLWGAGDRSLLKGGGVAIVGSRNVDPEGAEFTLKSAQKCADSQLPVVSGGARGVDQIAMKATVEAGGMTIGILADNLLKNSVQRMARNAIYESQLLLISPYHPKAHFTVGTAMGRNKLIYALADYGLVVSAEHGKGGTWAGATEELKRENARAIFVRSGENAPFGNKKLLDLGALPWPEIMEGANLITALSELSSNRKGVNKQQNLYLFDSFE